MSGQKGPIFRRPTRDLDDLPHDWTEWEQVAADHVGFGPAFEELVQAGCDTKRLFELTGELGRVRESEPRSRVGMEKIRRALTQAVEALEAFGRSGECALLKVKPGDLRGAWMTLSNLVTELRPLARKTDARRSVERNLGRALLVRYVRRVTGQWRDREVSEIVNGALAPMPNFGAEPEYDKRGRLVDLRSYRLPDDPWDPITVDAHRRWRGRNAKLIESAELEERWEQARTHAHSLPPF